jgi:DNA-binding NtrC family response regulator
MGFEESDEGRETVLVVDDDEEVLRLLTRALGRSTIDVLGAKTGAGALAALATGTVDLVILDVRLPDMDGLSVLESMAGMGPNAIVLTEHGAGATARRAMACGAYDYITKPFDVTLVVQVVFEALREGRRLPCALAFAGARPSLREGRVERMPPLAESEAERE